MTLVAIVIILPTILHISALAAATLFALYEGYKLCQNIRGRWQQRCEVDEEKKRYEKDKEKAAVLQDPGFQSAIATIEFKHVVRDWSNSDECSIFHNSDLDSRSLCGPIALVHHAFMRNWEYYKEHKKICTPTISFMD